MAVPCLHSLRRLPSSARWTVRRDRLSLLPSAKLQLQGPQLSRSCASSSASSSGGFPRPAMYAIPAVAAIGAGGAAFWFLYAEAEKVKEPVQVDVALRPISNEVFDMKDNLFLFFVESDEDLKVRHADITRIIEAVAGREAMQKTTYYYNLPRDDDPPSAPTRDQPPEVDGKRPVRCGMYKGQRKSLITISADDVPVQEIEDFFQTRSKQPAKAQQELVVKHISGAKFDSEVLDASSPKHLVLLQMFEDTCFLCFLMRPFVNSLAKVMEEHKVPISIKRLDIEKNDFPEGCPVARGTPTFVGFRGRGKDPDKWTEFRPKEICERLAQEFPTLPPAVMFQMETLQELVAKRFQLFTQLVMWTVELGKLEARLASMGSGAAVTAIDEESSFQTVVSKKMLRDMRRLDCVQENLEYLQGEVDEVEHDAALLGYMFAKAVLKTEQELGVDVSIAGRWQRPTLEPSS